MQKETKICPYCGEEIMASAKKCRYCGEWLVDDSQPSVNIKADASSGGNIKTNEGNIHTLQDYQPCSKYIVDLIYVVGVIASIILAVSYMDEVPTWLGKIRIVAEDMSTGVEQLATIIAGICFCALLFILKQTLVNCGQPFNGGMWLLISLYALSSIMDVVYPNVSFISIIIVSLMVVGFITIGLLMMNKYSGDLKKLGGVFVFANILFPFFIIASYSIFKSPDLEGVLFILSSLYTLSLYSSIDIAIGS